MFHFFLFALRHKLVNVANFCLETAADHSSVELRIGDVVAVGLVRVLENVSVVSCAYILYVMIQLAPYFKPK